MNKEQFIKQHPGLEGKGSGNGSYTSFHFLTIQETQLDKQKVKEAIEKCVKEEEWLYCLLKELRLE